MGCFKPLDRQMIFTPLYLRCCQILVIFKYSRQDRRCYSMFSTNLSDCVPNFDPLVYPYGDCNGIGMGLLDMIWWYMMGLLCILSSIQAWQWEIPRFVWWCSDSNAQNMLIGDSQPSLLTGRVADQQIGWPRSGQWGRYIWGTTQWTTSFIWFIWV